MKVLTTVILVLAIAFAMGVLVRIAQHLAEQRPLVCQCKAPECKCECPNPVLVANVSSLNEEPWKLSLPIPVPVLHNGQVLPLLENQWIKVALPDADLGEVFGDSCLAEARQSLVVLRTMGSLEALVRYKSTEKEGGGVSCKDGTLGVLDVADFAVSNQYSAEVAKQRQRVEAALQGVAP
jgi:hypothetical protein